MKINNKLKNIYCRVIGLLPFSVKGAIVLMYHSVGDNSVFFTVKPADFKRQMAYLHKHGFNVVSLSVLQQYLDQGVIPDKTVALTFDDGYEDNFINAFPILEELNFPAAIFLATGLKPGNLLAPLKREQIKVMSDSGLIDFEPHTVNHPKLTKIDIADAEMEIVLSRDFISRQLNKKTAYFAYPYGRYNDQIIGILERLGFQLGFTVESGVIKAVDNKFLLKRNSVDSSVTMAQFEAMVKFGKI